MQERDHYFQCQQNRVVDTLLQANGNRLLCVLILTLEHGDCKCEKQQKERKINSMTNEKTIELTNSELEVVENV
jgi:hypothetical protein